MGVGVWQDPESERARESAEMERMRRATVSFGFRFKIKPLINF
jgi:hypothetical protein